MNSEMRVLVITSIPKRNDGGMGRNSVCELHEIGRAVKRANSL